MKKSLTFLTLTATTLLLSACGSKGNGHSSNLSEVFANSPVAAEKVVVGEDTVVVGKILAETEPVTLLSSEVFDEFNLIKLEDTDDALTGGGPTWVSSDHIIIWDCNNSKIKLYNRKGKFIANVGAKGQGPGEYNIAPYFITIDEKKGRIYMMEYNSKQINAYNVSDGTFIESIPLAFNSPKGFCKVDSDKGLITVASIQFKGFEPSSPVWVQDFEGNLVSSVNRLDLGITPDFSNEISPSMTYDGSQIYHSQALITQLIADTLYRSDGKTLHPEFTYDFGKKVPMHRLNAFPKFYVLTTYGDPVMVSENSWIVGGEMPFVIERESLKGAPAELMIDQLGTLSFKNGWQQMSTPGYFSQSYDPGDLLDMLNAAPDSHPLANKEGLKRMEGLRNSIDPEGNNYVLIGHWKQ